MKRITLLLTLAAAVCAAASCVENLGAGGGAINFGASTGAAATKTEYGRDATATGSWESIKWVNTDQIRILCAQVDPQEKAYNITPDASTPTKTSAVTPADGEALQWGTGTHYFHASYPSSAPAAGVTFSHTLSPAPAPANSSTFKAQVPGSLPGEKWADNEYGPSMKYAYMYAATSSEANATEVNLAFQEPLVTAFRFSIYTPTSDPIPAGTKLTKVELSSASTNMAGVFQVVIGPDGRLHDGPNTLNTPTPTKSVSLDLGTGVELSQTTECAFTLFALPVNQTQLTLKLSFSDGSTRSLALKDNSNWVSVAGRKKLRISGLGVTPSGFTGWASEPYNPGGDPGINEVKQQNYLPGLFSVSDTEKVQFSRGNLQVNYTGISASPGYTREWLFSENQWDVFYPTFSTTMQAQANNPITNLPVGTTVKLSHFNWATAGHERTDSGGNGLGYGYESSQTLFEPHEFTSNVVSRYGISPATWESLIAAFADWNEPNNTWNAGILGGLSPANEVRSYCDWGIHFDDDGVGHDDKYDGTWFTMSVAQWRYLLEQRTRAQAKRGFARIVLDPVNNVYVTGLVIVPDDWQSPAGLPLNNEASLGHEANVYDASTEWPAMEASGAVFLPTNRVRTDIGGSSTINYNYDRGFYWYSSDQTTSSMNPYHLEFDCTNTITSHRRISPIKDDLNRGQGLSVRLVRYAPTTP